MRSMTTMTFLKVQDVTREGEKPLAVIQDRANSKFAIVPRSYVKLSGKKDTEGNEIYVPRTNIKEMRLISADWMVNEADAI